MQVCHLTTLGAKNYINGLVQDCSISIAKALDILQSCTKHPRNEISVTVVNYKLILLMVKCKTAVSPVH